MNIQSYTDHIERVLTTVAPDGQAPEGLYAPIRYGLSMGGKRLRPVLLMMTYRLFKPSGAPDVLDPAIKALEVFHNFTLLHDDLMDDAPVRRGKPTVYKKWDANTAILSGDAMLIEAYRQLELIDEQYMKAIYAEFGRMALEVCEGQQYDMEFEDRTDVTISQYLEMIRLKTACLIASAMKMGAILAGADVKVQEAVYRVGEDMGLAFQLVDDYLDVFADAEFGKRRGGDILEEKKTWLLIEAMNRTAEQDNGQLQQALQLKDEDEKIEAVTQCYVSLGLDQDLKELVHQYSGSAVQRLSALDVDSGAREELVALIAALSQRTV